MSTARVPASSANLGPGFDTLAVALALYISVSVEPADSLRIDASGEGADLPAGPGHLAARVVRAVTGHDRFTIVVRSEIPVGRGLGSSAALAVAAAAAAGASDPLEVAAGVDGHPENAAASVTGGLVTATTIGSKPVASQHPLDASLSFVVVVPDRALPTEEARAALPASVPHRDAAFNMGRMGLLLAGLADHTQLLPEATEDRLHQAFRSSLFPEAAAVMEGLRAGGALATCWSGAGPSLLAITTADTAGPVARAGERLLIEHGVPGRVLRLQADRGGLVVD